MTVAADKTVTLHNVLVGEVWICSGQSNMEFGLSDALNGQQEVAEANYPMIRLLTVPRDVAVQPQPDVKATWVACAPESAGRFSAVGYFFGRDLQQKLGVPVGLIHTSWGGTPVEAWTSRETLEATEEAKPLLERWEKALAAYPEAKKRYDREMAEWKDLAAEAGRDGQPAPTQPRAPLGPDSPSLPAGLYNGMIAPLVPYCIRGAIWYQGEANAARAYQYRALFKALIRDWRRAWGQGDFPFVFVQLANFKQAAAQPGESDWAELREAQTMALQLPETGMAVTIDIGDAGNIHPKNKQEVGRRLALAALATAYGQNVIASGPLYESMAVEGNKARLRFKNVGGGLEARGGEPLKGFAIAGADRRFVWAEARIEGQTAVVRSDQVPEPAAVRYAWADNPVCNLYNKEGLPASPFRTDVWPGITADKQ
jgi:sialate O-acetylesterase